MTPSVECRRLSLAFLASETCELTSHGIGWKSSLNTNCAMVREGTFFLGGGGLGPQRGGSSVKVSTKGGGPYPLFPLFKGRVTHLFQNF